ncbi:MAG TPA: dihydroneopterin aldolase [Micavibrio sp.]|jgi:dihydroneopterin aldolase|nr:dihydroneopterin aldolase [Micavibrio sp.]HIL29727.1 dihydroneopterin aldolase [Micavibrio sp.]
MSVAFDANTLPINSYVKVMLCDIEERLLIGLYDNEKGEENRQAVRIKAELFLDKADYVFTVTNETIVNYDLVMQQIATWRDRPHTELIETYLRELVGLCFQDERVVACRACIMKPEIYDHATAGVEAYITRADFESLSAA